MKRRKSISNVSPKSSYSNVLQLASSSDDPRKISKNRDQLVQISWNPPSLETIPHRPPLDVFVAVTSIAVTRTVPLQSVATRSRAAPRSMRVFARGCPSAHITRGPERNMRAGGLVLR